MKIFSITQAFRIDQYNYPQGGNFGPITGKTLGLIYFQRGSGLVTIDKGIYKLTEDTACFAPSDNFLNVSCQNGIRSTMCFCLTDIGEIQSSMMHRLHGQPPLFKPTDQLKKLFKLATRLKKTNDEITENYRNILGEAIFSEYLCTIDGYLNLEEYPEAVINTKQYIEEHFMEDCRIDYFSQKLGLSNQYLTKIFRKYIGNTPTAYLWKIRRKKALELLCNSDYPVNYISDACGFKSPYHFSKHMKKHYTHNPSELRQRYIYNLSNY